MQKFLSYKLELWIVFALSLCLCLANIWGYPISILDEAKNAEAAREMLNGETLLPLFNGILRTDKPPMHYLFMQLGYKIFGVNAMGARFFGALLGAGFMTYFFNFLRKFSSLYIARLSLLILLSSVFWIQEFHLAVPDPYLLVFLCSAWLLFYQYYQTEKRINLWLFYILVGFATLCKGPVAIGLTGLNVIFYLLIKREFTLKKILKFQPIIGGIIVLLIAVPWFVWIHFETNGEFTNGFFIKHNLERFGNEMEGHGGIFLITWAFVFLGLFPFGAFIPQGLWHGWKNHKKSDLLSYALVISLVVIIFFSISGTKLPNYTLPAIPFLAILISNYLIEIYKKNNLKNWKNTSSLLLISIVSIVIPIAIYILFNHPLLSNFQNYYTIYFIIILFIGLGYIWNNYLKNNNFYWIYSIGILWIFIALSIFYLIYPQLSSITPVIQANQWIQNKEVVVYKSYDPAFNINYQRNFKVIETEKELMLFIQKHPKTLVLTKNKALKNVNNFESNFEMVFREPSVFENYETLIFKFKGNY